MMTTAITQQVREKKKHFSIRGRTKKKELYSLVYNLVANVVEKVIMQITEIEKKVY
jgi:hypothetical protein